MPTDNDLLSTREAALLLGVTAETVRRWGASKRIKHVVMPSGKRLYRRQDIEAILTPVEPSADEAAL